jgi:hypothetical protein
MDKMETGRGHWGGSVEHSEGKGRESVVAILSFLCGSPCLCRLRTEGLVPMSKYWLYRSDAGVYEPSKPSSWLPTDAWLCPHCFIFWLTRETRYRPVDRPAGALWIVSGALFLRSSGPSQLCWRWCKRLPRSWTVCRKRTWGIRGLAREAHVSCWLGFLLLGVHQFKSPWLSDMSNRLFVATIK